MSCSTGNGVEVGYVNSECYLELRELYRDVIEARIDAINFDPLGERSYEDWFGWEYDWYEGCNN